MSWIFQSYDSKFESMIRNRRQMGYPVKLKIKIKALASEARIIRHEEKKLFENNVSVQVDDKTGDIIRKKQKWKLKPGREYEYTSLYTHRTNPVRKAARSAQLAYGFLRGRFYLDLEHKCHEPPKREEVHRLILRCGGLGHNEYTRGMLDDWFDRSQRFVRPKVELTG